MEKQALIAEREKAQTIWEEAHYDHPPLSMNADSSAERYRLAKNDPDRAEVAKLLEQARKDAKARVANGRKLEAAIEKLKELDKKIADAAD